MTMILALLLLGACVYAQPTLSASSSWPPTPPYLQLQSDIKQVAEILNQNVISMDGKIPDLTDQRRHYTEIVYVLYNVALSQSGCANFSYDEVYQEYVNTAAGKAIGQTQQVIDEIKAVVDEIHNKTEWVHQAIAKYCTPVTEICEEQVHDKVGIILGPLAYANPMFVAGGEAAKAFLTKHDEFLAESVQHSAHQYVIDGAAKLKELVKQIANLLKVVTNSRHRC